MHTDGRGDRVYTTVAENLYEDDAYAYAAFPALLAEAVRLRAVVATMATDCERVITQRDSLRAELAAQRALRDREVDGLRVENERLRAELEGVKP